MFRCNLRCLFLLATGYWLLTTFSYADDPLPPHKRVLDKEDAKRVAELDKKIDALSEAEKFQEAQQLAEEVLQVRTKAQGQDHWATVNARFAVDALRRVSTQSASDQAAYASLGKLSSEASALDKQRKYPEALALYEKALAINRKCLGEDHPHTARAYSDLAWSYDDQQKYSQAQPLFERALAVRQKALGEEHPAVATAYHGLGLNLTIQGKYAQGQGLLEKSLAMRQKLYGEEHTATATSYNSLGYNLNSQGKYRAAQPLYEKALAIRIKLLGEENADTILSYNNLATSLLGQGQVSKAQNLLEKTLVLSQKKLGEDHLDTARAYNNVAFILQFQGKLAQAADMQQKALAIYRKVYDKPHINTAMTEINLGLNLNLQGKYAQAQPLFESALETHRQVLGEKHKQTAVCYNNLAFNLSSQAKYVQAQPMFEKALTVHRAALGDEHHETIVCYNNVAMNLAKQGRFAQAEPILEKALTVLRRVRGEMHRETAVCYNNLAFNRMSQGKYGQAELFSIKALDIFRKIAGEEHADTVISYRNLAISFAGQRKYDQAQMHAEKALAICRKVRGPEHPEVAQACNSLAYVLSMQEKHEQAQPLVEEALQILRKGGREKHPDTLEAYYYVANNLASQGKYSAAQPLFENAVAISQELLGPEHPRTADTLTGLALNFCDQEHFQEAARSSQTALLAFECGRVQSGTTGFDRAIFRADTTSPRVVLAAAQAHLGKDVEAWQQAESYFGRALLDDAQSDRAAAAAHQARLTRIEQIDTMLVPLLTRSSLTPRDKEKREQLSRERAALLSALVKEAAERSQKRVLPFEQIQRTIPPDAALLFWLDIRKAHWACVLRREGKPTWQRLNGSDSDRSWSKDDLTLASRAYDALVEPSSNITRRNQLLEALRKQRLDPLEPHFQAREGLPAVRRLLIVPTGLMAKVPVEALTDRFLTSYVPSGTFFTRLVERHRPLQGDSLLVLGDPVFTPPEPGSSTAFRALPGTRIEVQCLSQLVPTPMKLLGSEASEQRLNELAESGKLKQFRLLHLATHGQVNMDYPTESALILSQDRLPARIDDQVELTLSGKKPLDGRLTVGAILEKWDLTADLVVLSACSTGLGKETGGEGMLGFAQALLQKGAHSVVLSRWKVDDSATALLMTRFYENVLGKRKDLKAPLPRAEALQEAKQWLRDLPRGESEKLVAHLASGQLRGTVGDPLPIKGDKPALPSGDKPYAAPYYWAAFVLIGDPG